MTLPPAAETHLSPGQRVILILLTAYKGLLSPLFGGSCRFVPSCSEYAREAVIQHGALRGSWMAAGRVSRCHPGRSYGLDPVPSRVPLINPTVPRT
jgi:putative membrane protein insertion efficiency factor